MNLKEVAPTIDHQSFCDALETSFSKKWAGLPINKTVLRVADLKKNAKIMELYESSNDWQWRFGQTPDFSNSLEHKFDWALVDVQFDVEKGLIVQGKVFSDCLIPAFIDELNKELATGEITYDVKGVNELCDRVSGSLGGEDSMKPVVETYVPQFRDWLQKSI